MNNFYSPEEISKRMRTQNTRGTKNVLFVVEDKKYNKRAINTMAGVFFTAEACEAHIESNKHNYTEPKSYAIYAYRNPEMEAVMKMLLKLSGEDIPDDYK